MRKPLVAGNWKMHGSRASIDQLLTGLTRGLPASEMDAEVVVCPAYVHITQAAGLCADSPSPIAIGAQDCSHMPSGAYTGEVAAPMLREAGCQWVILGHSERRQYHGESDDLVAAKLQAAIEAGLAGHPQRVLVVHSFSLSIAARRTAWIGQREYPAARSGTGRSSPDVVEVFRVP